MLAWILLPIGLALIILERFWPANDLPRVRAWWPRVILVNLIQLGLVFLAGVSWDVWLAQTSLFKLQDHMSEIASAVIAYVISTFIYYWWHRLRHDSRFFWRLCHQLHHSPKRIEIVTSFYKHPVEIACNSILSAAIVYTLLGCSVQAGVYYTLMTGMAEFFYHWNVKTPRWLGYVIQRPESHRVHHKYRHHTQNYADMPIFDMLFGTFFNPSDPIRECGFDNWREDRFEDLLAFRDLHGEGITEISPLHFLPTCIGCKKRWACQEARASADAEDPGSG